MLAPSRATVSVSRGDSLRGYAWQNAGSVAVGADALERVRCLPRANG
jgi:hypothetical protein